MADAKQAPHRRQFFRSGGFDQVVLARGSDLRALGQAAPAATQPAPAAKQEGDHSVPNECWRDGGEWRRISPETDTEFTAP
jgi:hypothetical protein